MKCWRNYAKQLHNKAERGVLWRLFFYCKRWHNVALSSKKHYTNIMFLDDVNGKFLKEVAYMDFSNFSNFEEWIYPELAVLIPVLYGLGLILKHMEFINDKFIPVILTVVSVALSCLYILPLYGIGAESIFTGIVQGVVCAAVAVYGNQLYKQSTK